MKYIAVKESDLNNRLYSPLQVVFLLIRYRNSYLLKRDFVGGHWELPATQMNDKETPRECILHNYSEKYGFNDSGISVVGIAEVVFEKTEWRPEPKPEYLVLLEADVDNAEDAFKNVDKELHLWYNPGDDVKPICSLCRQLMEAYPSMKSGDQ